MTMQQIASLPHALREISQGRDHIKTSEFAKATSRSAQTIRKYHATDGHAFGIRPRKIGNFLLWPVSEIAVLLSGNAK